MELKKFDLEIYPPQFCQIQFKSGLKRPTQHALCLPDAFPVSKVGSRVSVGPRNGRARSELHKAVDRTLGSIVSVASAPCVDAAEGGLGRRLAAQRTPSAPSKVSVGSACKHDTLGQYYGQHSWCVGDSNLAQLRVPDDAIVEHLVNHHLCSNHTMLATPKTE
eukprot:1836409-Rhodomonas_salina.4